MEGRKRSGMLKKSVCNMRKRLVAFALAAAMVCTNVGADLNAAYGATSSSESVTFEMTGSQFVTAIEEAIENGLLSEAATKTQSTIKKYLNAIPGISDSYEIEVKFLESNTN